MTRVSTTPILEYKIEKPLNERSIIMQKFRLNFTIFDEDGNEVGRIDSPAGTSVPLDVLPAAMAALASMACAGAFEYNEQKESEDFAQSVAADLEALPVVS